VSEPMHLILFVKILSFYVVSSLIQVIFGSMQVVVGDIG
jgi:hypothetical protein